MMSKRIKFCIITLLVIIVTACSNDKKELPAGVLPHAKMVTVLADIEEAEARMQISGMNLTDSSQNAGYRFYKYIFQKNNITDSVFRKSFSYYSNNLELLDKIYDDVITELSRRQGIESAKKK